MPVTFKAANVKYKSAETGQYVGVNSVSDNTTAEQIALIEEAGEEQIEVIEAAEAQYVQTAIDAKDDAVAAAAQAQAALMQDVATVLPTLITNPDSPPLDRTLTQALAAAPADLVGGLMDFVGVYSAVIPYQTSTVLYKDLHVKVTTGTKIRCKAYGINEGTVTDVKIYGTDGDETSSALKTFNFNEEGEYVFENTYPMIRIRISGSGFTSGTTAKGYIKVICGGTIAEDVLNASQNTILDENESRVFYVITSDNLFNKNDYALGTISADGAEGRSTATYLSKTPIRVIGTGISSTYQLRKVFYDKNRKFLSRTDSNTYSAIPAGAEYVRFIIATAIYEAHVDDMMINVGDSVMAYRPFSLYTRIVDEKIGLVIDDAWKNYFYTSDNLFDKDDVELGAINKKGVETESDSVYRTKTPVRFIGANIITNYKIRRIFYDKDMNFISRSVTAKIPVEVPENAEYVRFVISKPIYDLHGSAVMVNVGKKVQTYKPFALEERGSWDYKIEALKEKTEKIEDGLLPEYYTDYMEERITDVNDLQNSVPLNSDSFIFITDYHIGEDMNTGNACNMIKQVVKKTGITKLFFGGDAYRTITSDSEYTDAEARAESDKYVPAVYSMLQACAPEFFSVLGNHEWNHRMTDGTEQITEAFENSRAGVYNMCIKRHESSVSGMTTEGNYYVDNKVKKIRYFFLQVNGDIRPTPETVEWLGEQLLLVPNDYYVAVIIHYAYVFSETPSTDTYVNRSKYCVKTINDMLQAYNTHSAYSVDFSLTENETTVTYDIDFNFSSCPGQNVIGIISGHVHRDLAVEKSSSTVLSVATTCDRYGYEDEPYTYMDDEQNVYERTPGTVREQAFDVVHIDLENRKVYLTRFGGGFDREFDF